MPFTYIPAVPGQFFLTDGSVAASALLFVYASGTTTKITTYTTSSGTANANPIVLDSAGRATIFLDPEEGDAKFVLEPSTAKGGTDPPTSAIWTRDEIKVIPDSTNTDVFGTAAETMNATVIAYLDSSGEWRKADADSLAKSAGAPVLGFPTSAIGAPLTGFIRVAGRVTGLSVVAGSVYYVHSTAGAITATKPTTLKGGVRVVGVADTSTSLILTPHEAQEDVAIPLYQIGFSSGEANDGGSQPTILTGYSGTILGGLLSAAGHQLIIEGTFTTAANGNTKSAHIKMASGTSVQIFTTTGSGHVIPFRMVMRYRTSTTGALTGISWIGAAAAGAPTNYLVNSALGSVDWTIDQALTIAAESSVPTAGDTTLTDYNVTLVRGPGSSV